MSEPVLLIIFLAVGYVTGVASGLLGIGGGVIFVPALYFLLPFYGIKEPHLFFIAVATSLFAGSFASASSFFHHFKAKNVRMRCAVLLAAGSLASAFLVPRFITSFNATYLRYFLIALLVIVAVRMFFDSKNVESKYNLNQYFLIFFGLLVGAVSAVTGLGGGVFFVPILAYLFSVDLKQAIGSATFVVALTMIGSSISYAFVANGIDYGSYQFGYINLLAGIPMGITAIFGAKVGVGLIMKYPVRIIKKVFAVFLVGVIIKMLFG